MKLVLKFGGSSVGNGTKISNVCEIIKKVKKDNQVIVVSSALQSTTDELLELAEDAKKGKINEKIIEEISQRHHGAIKEIIKNNEIQNEVSGIVSELIEELQKTVNGVIKLKNLVIKLKTKLFLLENV